VIGGPIVDLEYFNLVPWFEVWLSIVSDLRGVLSVWATTVSTWSSFDRWPAGGWWLVADGWCWFVLREKYCWLIAGGWFVLREKYCWLVADKPNEQPMSDWVETLSLVWGPVELYIFLPNFLHKSKQKHQSMYKTTVSYY
jgi:hypothetical protein